MRVLITGGAGFIGSHLVDELLGRNHQITVLDNLSTGKLSNLPDAGSIRFIRGDVADQEAVLAAAGEQEAVVHLAAVASVQASVDDPLLTNRTNLTGTINLLEAAANAGTGKFLYASSASVYGDQKLSIGTPLHESAPLAPQTPYAIDKLAGEQYLRYYHSTGRLTGTAFRFFNIFGPRQDPSSPYSGVISIFNDRLTRGLPISVFGDGEQTRDFVFVQDLVRLLADRLESESAEGELPVVNVGSGSSTSLLQLIDHLAAIHGVKPDVSFEAARVGDIRHSLAGTTGLTSMFGQRQLTPVRAGLQQLAASTEPA